MSNQDTEAAVDEILARFPGPVRIVPNKFRLVINVAILSAPLFAFFGLVPVKWWLILQIDGLIASLLALVWVIGLIRLLWTNKPILILDQKGMTSNRALGQQQTAEWKDVESCEIGGELGAVLVTARDRSPHRWRDQKIIKVSWLIEPNYDALIKILTQWRERALQTKG